GSAGTSERARRSRAPGPVVVKVGGSVLTDGVAPELARALARLHDSGVPTVLVHGGGSHVTDVLDRLGLETEFVDGLRVTTPEVMEVVEMVLAGRVNKSVVSGLQKAGILAVGISGKDGGTLKATPHPEAARLGQVGQVASADTRLVQRLLDGGYLPVVCSVAGSDAGGTFNVNADDAAAALASSLGAAHLVLLTDVPGVLRDGSEVISHLTPAEARQLLDEGAASGGMRPKIRACLGSLERGVEDAHIVGEGDVGSLLELVTGRVRIGTTLGPAGAPAAASSDSEAPPPGAPEEGDGVDPAVAEIRDRAGEHLLGTYLPLPIAFQRGRGARLRGVDGKEYLDFIGGIAVSTLGHAHPALIDAVAGQASRYIHVSNLYLIPEQVRAAELLVEASGLDRVFFCNSGAESVEGVIKIARKWGGKRKGDGVHRMVVMEGAFHGRTLGALSATANPRYRDAFEPLTPGFDRVPYNDLAAVDAAIDDRTCAVLVEPIQGEGGVVPADPEYLRGLRELTRERDVLLALDEVQTGMGRTGHMFAYQHYGITPDLVALSKGLGGGVPVGAVLATEPVAGVMEPGDHATTFGGNALSSSAAVAVLTELIHRGGLEQAREAGRRLRERLDDLVARHEGAASVRGIGLLLALEVKVDGKALARGLADRGLLVNALGGSALRLAPPLVLESGEMDEALEILEAGLTQAWEEEEGKA
ncbi:MAG: acetylglutamate kinase, partial [Longimicrobiales bacterium]|nr:acetylglutamate kinase [Longimicrobiales bacterium]